MENNVNRILIEAAIKKTLNQIQDDPERSIRNLVDMALNFSEGRFQHRFFKIAQDMLQNEQSCYYRILPDIVANVDKERILTFGMNIGYNSCTNGAKTIRKTEETEHFNIPWSISLKLNGLDYVEKKEKYHLLISQGVNLGIYTWNIFSLGQTPYLIEMIHSFPECAFIVFCTPGEIIPTLLDELNAIHNVMFVVQLTRGVEDACELLRSGNHLYSVYYPYQEQDIMRIISGDLLSDTENLHPVFTALLAMPLCSQNTRSRIYQYIQQARSEQKYKTIPFDVIYDTLYIDSIISDEACSIGFNKEGICYSFAEQTLEENTNFFDNSLYEILKIVSPKKKNNNPVTIQLYIDT